MTLNARLVIAITILVALVILPSIVIVLAW